MRIKLPRELRGLAFPRITTLELNGFDVDLLLPSLFFRILAEGAGRARRANDPTAINSYVGALASHPDVEGFSESSGERVLNRLVRTSLAVTGRTGARTQRKEQIVAVAPLSVLSHKTGLPAEGSRQRNVDTFIYEVLRERSGSDLQLRAFIARVFGKGVLISRLPQLGGSYDGTTELDTLTRLSLAFLDGFQPTPAGRKLGRIWAESCPFLANSLGSDIQHYLYTFHDHMPPQALTYNLLALINFELFVYTLKVVYGINELVRNPASLPPALQAEHAVSPPQIYLDFTAEPGGLSQHMAAACVRRDLDAYEPFLSSVLTLRQLDRYVEVLARNPRVREQLDFVLEAKHHSSPEYLQALLQMVENPSLAMAVDAQALSDEDAIRQSNQRVALEEEEGEDLAWLDALLPGHLSPLHRVVTLLSESQKRAITNMGDWFRGSGGLLKPYGILAGTLKGRRAWRYQPSNDLLAVLVQLASIQPQSGDDARELRPVPLRDFLSYLYERFGILVDRPPAPFSGAEAVAAARQNLSAMLRRLRQMGIFRDLSDDFTVQALQPPYAAAQTRP